MIGGHVRCISSCGMCGWGGEGRGEGRGGEHMCPMGYKWLSQEGTVGKNIKELLNKNKWYKRIWIPNYSTELGQGRLVEKMCFAVCGGEEGVQFIRNQFCDPLTKSFKECHYANNVFKTKLHDFYSYTRELLWNDSLVTHCRTREWLQLHGQTKKERSWLEFISVEKYSYAI